MKCMKIHSMFALFALLAGARLTHSFAKTSDVYFIFYATIDGKSGHAGVAIDNYKIRVRDVYNEKNQLISVYDTLRNGTLTYYDLWPAKDNFDAITVNKAQEPKYFKLPAASWEDDITVNSLLEKGIPHEEGFPVDGLIRIPTSPKKDYQMYKFMQTQIDANKPFHPRDFNCADFVEIAIEKVCGCSLKAKEYIFFKFSTTPNKLYQQIAALPNIIIIKNAAEKAKGSFTTERLFVKRRKESINPITQSH